MQTSADPALTLDYQSPRPAPTIGNSRVVRLAALLTSLILLVLIGHFLQRSRETLGGLSDWILPLGAALAGAVYCALVSVNVAGRTKPGSTSWLRRIGGIGAPLFLIISAAGWVQDILVDPYARRHDVVIWMAVAVATGTVAVIIAYLGLSHWNDTNQLPEGHAVAG